MPEFILDTSGEEWRAVVGYEGSYEVSSLGNVRSLPRTVMRGSRAMQIQGMQLRPRTVPPGYKYVNLRRDSQESGVAVHRLVALAFVPNPDGKPNVNHCDNHPANNAAVNLVWSTQAENVAHAARQLRLRGHLTEGDVHALREVWPHARAGDKGRIATLYGIGRDHFWKIGTGRAHTHVPQLDNFTGGYMAALRESLPLEAWRSPLASETLARIIKDCAAIRSLQCMAGEPRGGDFVWHWRQEGRFTACGFPPITIYLGDDGKVCVS